VDLKEELNDCLLLLLAHLGSNTGELKKRSMKLDLANDDFGDGTICFGDGGWVSIDTYLQHTIIHLHNLQSTILVTDIT
jgi:hypothetical protein